MGNCETVFKQARRVAAQNLKALKEATDPPMTQHQTPPSVTDEMVERAAHRFMEVYFRNAPDDTLIDVEEVERAMLSALTAALAAMPGGVDEEVLKTIKRIRDTAAGPVSKFEGADGTLRAIELLAQSILAKVEASRLSPASREDGKNG